MPQILNKKNQKKIGKFVLVNVFEKLQKSGHFCGHKWPEGIICASEKFFHIKFFGQIVRNGAKQDEMIFQDIFFHFKLN